MSSLSVLITKLYMPPASQKMVRRARLVEALEEGVRSGHRLSLICAPAGFGKTTLLSDWLRQPGGACAWLSLDQDDDDPARFWSYVVAALQTVHAGLGQEVVPLLQAPQQPAIQAILTPVLNQASLLGDRVILVLDDYHLLSDPAIHEGVAFFIEHLPPQLHLVISTRADPPLPVHRLRGRGQLTELRSRDLRFTPDEASAFLNRAMDLDLAREDVERLEARTEGWIVGLQLAALSLQGRSDAHEFITAFGGGHHYVLEYLAEEVVRRQPEAVQRFLMQTSILGRLNAPLCDAVTGAGDGDEMLAHLQKHNLFIVPLDDEYKWFRYHHLFSDLLGNLRRKRWSQAAIRELHLHACEWYDRNGWVADAVSHALAAEDFQRTARLIEAHSLAMVMRGELARLLRWIRALPEDVARSRPWLCVHQAWPLVLAGKADEAEPLWQQIEQQVAAEDPASEKEIVAHVAAMRAMAATFRGEMAQAVGLAHQASMLLPPGNVIPRNTILFVLASAYSAQGDLVQAARAMAEQLQVAQAADILWTIVRSLCDLADVRMIEGRLEEAADLARRALEEAEARGARQFGTVGYVLVKLGEILYERNELAAAHDYVAEGVDLMQSWRQPYEMASAYSVLATVLQARSDPGGARDALQKAEEIQSQHPRYVKLSSLVRSCRVRLCLAQDGAAEALRQATEIQLGETHIAIFLEQERIVLARVLIAGEKWDEALSLLTELAVDAEAGSRSGRLIEILALKAAAWHARGETDRALRALEQALFMGEPEGYVRVFVEGGTPMADLLRQVAARAQGRAAEHARALLGTMRADVPRPDASALQGTQALVEALTEREGEVLQLLGQGLSNREIAEVLVITVNGVKKHTSNIYGKLDVHSRTQAVVRAQELGLL